eukprot:16430160-Heterocapsa_arctica.AAC.2
MFASGKIDFMNSIGHQRTGFISLGKANNEQRRRVLPNKSSLGLGNQEQTICNLTRLGQCTMPKLHSDKKMEIPQEKNWS